MSRSDKSKMPHRFPYAAQCSFPEQIAVRSGSGKCQHQNIALNAVDQKPVGLNVALPLSTLVAGQVMISVLRRQRVSHCKRFDHGFKKLDLQSALDCQLVILLERRGRLDGQLCFSYFFRSAKSSSRSL